MRKFLSLLSLVLFIGSAAMAQNKITGTVKDQNGDPVPFATVNVKGTNVSVAADADAFFSIPAKAGDVLSISAVGIAKTDVTVDGATVNVVVQRTNSELSEVVVTAGGIVKRKSEIGSAQTVLSGNAVTKGKSINIAGGLVAKVAGLQVQGTTSGVNPNYRIVLRGNRSLTGNNEALIVLDNVIVPNSVLGNLNPEDIQSYNILQGASAAALYGSQASNGAIIITTKKGTIGQTTVRVAQTETIEHVAYFPKMQSSYGQGGSSYGYDANGQPNFSPIENQSYGPHFNGKTVELGVPLEDGSQDSTLYTGNDTRKDFWAQGLTNQTDFSVSSGDKLSTMYVSGQYASVTGTTPKDRYNRATLRLGGTRKIYGDKLNVSYSISYTQNNYDITTQTGDIYNNMLNMPSNIDITKYANWKTDKFANPNGYYNPWYLNPYWELDNYRQNVRNEYMVGNVQLKYSPLSWLSFTARQGITKTNQYSKSYNNGFQYTEYAKTSSSNSKSDISASVSDGESYSLNLLSDLFLEVNKKVNDFSIYFLAGGQWNQNAYKGVGVSASPLVVPELYNVGNLVGIPGASESNYLQRIMGVYGKVTLGYKDYVYLNVTGRNDWTSVLAPDSRSFFYPSADISFVASQALDFLKNSNVIDYLKIRGGVSKVGEVNLPGTYGAYQLQRTYSQQSGFPYGSLPGFALNNTIVAAGLQPEITKQYEFGFDMNLLKNRITTAVTWWHSVTDNQTVSTGVSYTSGGSSYLTNVGETMGQGLELELHYTPIRTRDLTVTIGGNYSYLDNKVNSISADVDKISLAAYGDGSGSYAVAGQPFPVIMGLDFVRDSKGHVVVDASTGEPSLDPTLKLFGNAVAKDRIGLDFDINWKGFELTGTFEYRGAYNMYFGAGSSYDWAGTGIRTTLFKRGRFVFPNSVYVDKTGDTVLNTNITLIDGNGNAGFWTSDDNRGVSSNYISSGAFWKLRELSLSYQLPKSILSKTKFIKTLTISLQGRNLFYWLPKTNFYTDPEYSEVSSTSNGVGITGISSAPPSRYYGGTISLTF
ncbi:MAG: SusC/RagA family TonB-linked outer membrane protein [Bacteroidetes bacterium]|nr:SusC/RagA family TonB-linked outer membrane protein [Bacteroidota bacterium]